MDLTLQYGGQKAILVAYIERGRKTFPLEPRKGQGCLGTQNAVEQAADANSWWAIRVAE